MKKIAGILLMLILVPAVLCCCGEKEELTEYENAFVGEWELADITYFYSPKLGTMVQYWYPSKSSKFNALCEQYLDKTSLILYDDKKNWEMTATLKQGDTATDFYWYGDDNSSALINFRNAPTFKILSNNGLTQTDGHISYALKNSKGKLCFIFYSNFMYIFEKKR